MVVLGGDGVRPPWPFLSLTVVTLQTVGARRTAAKPGMAIVPARCGNGKEGAVRRTAYMAVGSACCSMVFKIKYDDYKRK
ncbi:hypothetical protein TRIUR3_25114 [Triticum urartu]|uniref:Uncharacterized protein n=1 Tax=Triticum urartu TaxID=4572 RepID=M7ZNG5_TRIUA|nr:hypothetical protein TRIUR3_25114 [Triticum urartu]